MKNIILIHGYNGIPKIYEWLKEKLVRKGNLVIMPKFPTQEGVIYDIWKKDWFGNYPRGVRYYR